MNSFDNLVANLVPIISVTLGIVMVIVAIVTKHWRDVRELDNRHRERMAAIEKGLDLPPDPVASRPVVANRVTNGGSPYLRRGLLWLGVGVAVALSHEEFREYGWIAAAVGVAYLIYYAVEGRREGPPPGSRPGGGGPPA